MSGTLSRQSRPEFATLDFILVTSLPNKVLTDESLTLQEADILNTVDTAAAKMILSYPMQRVGMVMCHISEENT